MQNMEIVLAEDSALGKAGQKVTLALSPTDVHVSEEMSTYLAGYNVPNYRADEASKVILVDTDEDKYRSMSSDDAFKPVQVKASHQQKIPEVDPKTDLLSYKVVDRLVGAFVPTVVELNAVKAFKPRQAAMQRCKRALQIDRELDVWTLLTTSGSWNANNVVTLAAGFQWNGGATSDPIFDLMTLAERSVMSPIEFWMNQKVANYFIRHDKVRDHFRFMNGDAAMASTIQSLNEASAINRMIDFVIPAVGVVHVCGAKYRNAAGAIVPFLGDSYVVATHSPPGVPTSGEDIASTFTFRRKGPSGTGFETREFFVNDRGPLGGTMIVTSMADVAKITSTVVGGLISGVIQ
jgi:hypothetical protein